MIGLGIDGGGTKTEALLADDSGHIRGLGRAGPTNMFFVSREEAAAAFRAAVGAALSDAKSDRIDAMVVSAEAADDLLADLATRYNIPAWRHVEEPEAALAVGQPFSDARVRVVVCAGTGSMALGIGEGDKRLIAGAAGPLIGDEGSAYWLGQRALTAAYQAFDGRCERSPLTERLHRGLGAPADFRSFIRRVYGPPMMNRYEIAALAPLVSEAAIEGDPLALELVRKAAYELAQLVYALGHRLDLLAEAFAVLPYGGVFHAGRVILAPFEAEVRAIAPRAHVLAPVFHPALGAALMALELVGAPLSPDALATFAAERERWRV